MNGIILILVACIAASKCEVRTFNNAFKQEGETTDTNSLLAEYPFELEEKDTIASPVVHTLKLTDSLCPTRTVPKGAVKWYGLPESNGATFYLKRKSALYSTKLYTRLTKFPELLTLPQHIGLHEVVIFENTLSIEELETALHYALQPSIEVHLNNTGQNVSAVRIIFPFGYSNSPMFSETGFPVRQFTYTLIVSDTLRVNTEPIRHSGRYTPPTVLQKIPSPNRVDFLRRLGTKGVVVYQGSVYMGESILLKGAPHKHNFEQIKRDLLSELEASHNRSYTTWDPLSYEFRSVACNMSKGDVNVHIGLPHPGLIISNDNSTYSQIPATHLPYMITVREKIFGSGSPIETGQHTSYLSFNDLHSQNKTLLFAHDIFRLYSSLPVNFQLLPILGNSVAKYFNQKLGNSNLSTIVRFIDPDLDSATTLNFIIDLAMDNESILPLDSRMFYGKQIYDHLEGLRIDLNTFTEPKGGRHIIQLSRQPFPETADPQRQTFLQNCANGQKIGKAVGSYGDCPLSDTFSMALLQTSGEFPSTAKIFHLVQEAFTEANPITLDEAYFTVALKKREDIFQNEEGLRIVRFDFSFSHFNLESGKFWNIWRFPTDAIVRRLSQFNPPITIGYSTVQNEQQANHTSMQENIQNFTIKKSASGLMDMGDAVPAGNSTFSVYLEKADAIIPPSTKQRQSARKTLREKSNNALRAVGDAFAEANSQKARDDVLTVTLTGYDDDLWTVNGLQVIKFDFSVESSDGGHQDTVINWRQPTYKVLQMHLQKTASARLASDPLTY